MMFTGAAVGCMFCTSCHSWGSLIQVHSKMLTELKRSRKDHTWVLCESLMILLW